MNSSIERRLDALEAAVKQHTAVCNCGGNGVRVIFTDVPRWKREPLPSPDLEDCPLHGPVLTVVFDDPTQAPPGYDRKRIGSASS